MKLGIFSRMYTKDLEDSFRQMNQSGIHYTQFNMSSAGLETMPLSYTKQCLDEIKELAIKYDIKLAALSGTFNMIDPNLERLEDDILRFEVLCEIAAYLEIPIITLCTGSKNPNSKWEWDDANLDESSWVDLIETTKRILPFAEKYNIVLGVETEASNIVNTPQKAKQFMDVFQSENIKIIMDGANLFVPSKVPYMNQILDEAFELLGDSICLVHAKDFRLQEGIEFVSIGEGDLNFNKYLTLVKKSKYKGPIIIHGISEDQVDSSLEYLKGKM